MLSPSKQNQRHQTRNQSSVNALYTDSIFFGTFTWDGQNENIPRRDALIGTTREALQPYMDFLSAAISAEKERGEYECRFRIISKQSFQISPKHPRYFIPRPLPKIEFRYPVAQLKEKKNRLYIEDIDQTISFDAAQVMASPDGQAFSLSQDVEKRDILPKNKDDASSIELNGNSLIFDVSELDIHQGCIFHNSDKSIPLGSVEPNEHGWNISISGLFPKGSIWSCNGFYIEPQYIQESPQKLFIRGDQPNPKEWSFEKNGSEFYSSVEPNGNLVDENGIEYTCRRKSESRSDIIVELLDDDTAEGEIPVSDHFFNEESLVVYQGDKNKARDNSFEVSRMVPDEHRLYLKQPYTRDGQSSQSLDSSKPLKMLIDTANLERQRNAVRALALKPVKEHRSLVQLFEKKDRPFLWPRFNPRSVDNWWILRDETFPGTESQRRFVEKALGTNDFALLEGPPGSGKTTTILELILQLIQGGKRVLLTASTHVAIDNVLDRLPKDCHVVPLRIGRSDSVSESVNHFQLENKVNSLLKTGVSRIVAERCALDSANLVCGTTMGIQNHPDIRAASDWKEDRPIDPMYDYLIIDEASKTTFQEFLVPAMHAKKWIIVGDIQQLSPYSEANHLRHSLNSVIDADTKTALRILLLCNDCLKSREALPLAIELPASTLKIVIKALTLDRQRETPLYGELERTAFFQREQGWFSIGQPTERMHLAILFISDILFFEQGTWEMIKNQIPESHCLLRDFDKDNVSAFRNRQALWDRKRPGFDIEKMLSKDRIEQVEKLFDERKKLWADEISWRMIREFERRNIQKKSYAESSLELLKPWWDEDALNKISRIGNLFFPSVLESLQQGNGEKHKNMTTITDGFGAGSIEFKCRFERLDVQHRMHPDISCFSREHFYSGLQGLSPLKDSPRINRDWSYYRYSKRAVWIPITRPNNLTEKDNINKLEVERLMFELKAFVDWATINPSENGSPWTVGVLTYYRPQEALIRTELRKYCSQPNKHSLFFKSGISIQLFTVDKFQGREADVIFLSMVRNRGIGFMDNTNRLNVALTRAKYQRVIIGNRDFFLSKRSSDVLRDLAQSSEIFQ